ncbi:hypothetical protein [Nocardia flavorosea]|uniref:Uncharacterized protein n=1 Tax=Nocardia flavorosea TaxID=53429 RepID=A0A846YFI4_9NOCA|nr:hypothetical protein [Nocardia flavorosea]NKY55599.1 hypothetical protein [Nocardia flavorosea]
MATGTRASTTRPPDTSYTVNAIGRKGDLIVYAFIRHLDDFGAESREGIPAYRFNDEQLVDWVLNGYMPQTHADLLAKKDAA